MTASINQEDITILHLNLIQNLDSSYRSTENRSTKYQFFCTFRRPYPLSPITVPQKRGSRIKFGVAKSNSSIIKDRKVISGEYILLSTVQVFQSEDEVYHSDYFPDDKEQEERRAKVHSDLVEKNKHNKY